MPIWMMEYHSEIGVNLFIKYKGTAIMRVGIKTLMKREASFPFSPRSKSLYTIKIEMDKKYTDTTELVIAKPAYPNGPTNIQFNTTFKRMVVTLIRKIVEVFPLAYIDLETIYCMPCVTIIGK